MVDRAQLSQLTASMGLPELADFALELEGHSTTLRCKIGACSWRQVLPVGIESGDERAWDPALGRQLWNDHLRIAHPDQSKRGSRC